jgi:DNA-binding CsgD family transcriptional regulator
VTVATVRQRPTRRQVEVLRAYIDAGSMAEAAQRLDIAAPTVRPHLSALYKRTGCANAAQAAYLLGRADVPLPIRVSRSHATGSRPRKRCDDARRHDDLPSRCAPTRRA